MESIPGLHKRLKIRALLNLRRSWFMWTDTLLYRARILKIFVRLTVDSKESIPYNLSPLSVCCHGASNTSAQCILNVNLNPSSSSALLNFSVWARVNICYIFHTWFLLNTRNRLYSLNPSQNFASAYVYYSVHFHKCTATLLKFRHWTDKWHKFKLDVELSPREYP